MGVRTPVPVVNVQIPRTKTLFVEAEAWFGLRFGMSLPSVATGWYLAKVNSNASSRPAIRAQQSMKARIDRSETTGGEVTNCSGTGFLIRLRPSFAASDFIW